MIEIKFPESYMKVVAIKPSLFKRIIHHEIWPILLSALVFGFGVALMIWGIKQ